MIQYDRDALAAIDTPAAEKAVAGKRGQVRNGVPILDPAENPGLLTLIPVPKNPHGVNVTPDGRYAIAAGKLSPTVTIVDAHTLKIVAEPEVGLGPLHTTFDNRGNAYTSLFLDSQVVKWNIDKVGPVKVGNFTVWSFPHVGAVLLLAAAGLSIAGTRRARA